MKDELKAAFDPIHAPEELKQSTRQALQYSLQQKHTHSFPGRISLSLAAAACLFFVLFSGYRLYFTPTSVISIDINPSLELSVNRFNRVIDAEGYNEDGIQLVQSLNLIHQTYEQAMDSVLSSPTVVDCLARDELLSIAVVETDAGQGQEILNYVSKCTKQTPGTICYGVRQEEVAQAHDLGLSYGKYQVYLDVKAQFPDITPEQIASMTMREIRELLIQSGSASDEFSSGGCSTSGQGNGKKHGKKGANFTDS